MLPRGIDQVKLHGRIAPELTCKGFLCGTYGTNHIRDVALVFSHGIDNYDAMKGRPYNVGLSDANLSKLELCERIKNHLPEFVFSESKIGEDPDKRNYIVCNSRIEGTGWSPAFSLDDGIAELIKAYRIVRQRQFGNF